METKKIFVFGNTLVEEDSLAQRVAERLKGKVKGFEFEAVQSLDEVKEKNNLYIMDVAVGIERVQLVEDLEKLQAKQPVSSHDLDLVMELKMLRKVGKLQGVKIIAIPAGYDLGEAAGEVKGLLLGLSSSPSKSGLRS